MELLIIDENEFDHVHDKWKSKKFEDDKHKLEKTSASDNVQEAELKKKVCP